MGEEEGALVIDIVINNELDKKIVDQFVLFDELDIKKIDSKEVGKFIHSLGLFITNDDIEDIKKKSFFPKLPNEYHIGYLLPHISECFMKHKFMSNTIEQLYDAFYILDPDKKGILEKSYIQEVFMNNGDPFDDEEMKEFMVRAVDHRTQKINYEYLMNALCIKIPSEEDLFKLADTVVVPEPEPKA